MYMESIKQPVGPRALFHQLNSRTSSDLTCTYEDDVTMILFLCSSQTARRNKNRLRRKAQVSGGQNAVTSPSCIKQTKTMIGHTDTQGRWCSYCLHLKHEYREQMPDRRSPRDAAIDLSISSYFPESRVSTLITALCAQRTIRETTIQ